MITYNRTMKKIKYSDFENINDIIQQFDFNYDAPKEDGKLLLFNSWESLVGSKIASVSMPIELTEKAILKISCANSFVANELFMQKQNLMTLLKEKAQELNLEIKDLMFDYKNWAANKQ